MNTSIYENGAIFNGRNYLSVANNAELTLYLPPAFDTPITIDLGALLANAPAIEAGNAVDFTDANGALAQITVLQEAIDAVIGMITGYQGLVNVMDEYQNATGDQRTLLETNFKNWKDDRLCNIDKQIEETTYK